MYTVKLSLSSTGIYTILIIVNLVKEHYIYHTLLCFVNHWYYVCI